jgi:seryl-tRNA synthetase
MTTHEPFRVAGGFATLGPELCRVRELLQARLLAWADECQAERMVFPPLMRVEDLASIDYFQNFPQLLLLAAPLRGEALAGDRGALVEDSAVPSARLDSSEYALPSAACYNVYLHLRDSDLPSPRYVTTVATCFRNEQRYEGLRRLRGFSMQEIVCVGERAAVQAHLAAFKLRVLEFARELGLELEVRPASDPFFQASGDRAVLQKLFPVKEEFVHRDSLAIASLNFHRNFFGERCRIRVSGGEPAFSGCVAFGLERWLAALLEAHGQDVQAIQTTVMAAVSRARAASEVAGG